MLRLHMLFLIGLISVHITLFGQKPESVDEDELKSINQTVEFINYVGPHKLQDSVKAIRGIGAGLARNIEINVTSESTLGNKYKIIHIVDPETLEGLDADLLILEPESAVDHIDNLRIIIAGYLQDAYQYNWGNALLIAKFITYYNAVYRGDIEVVRERYKPKVLNYINPPLIGIDTHYSNWPGRTQLIIPLRLSSGTNESPIVDSVSITEKAVIDKLKKTDSRGIQEREAMVNLLEEEIRRAEEQSQAVNTQSAENPAETQESQASKNQTQNTTENTKKITKKTTKITKKTRQKKQIDRVLEMRDEIAKDKNEMLRPEEPLSEEPLPAPEEPLPAKKEVITPLWLLHVDSLADGIPFGRVIKYNSLNGEKLNTSSITSVRGRQMLALSDDIFVIAGKEGDKTQVRPILLDKEKLELKLAGQHSIFPGSMISTNRGNIYLITRKDGAWHLGRFSKALELIAISDIPVEPWTSISFTKNLLLVQTASGQLAKLSPGTLKLIEN